jgi:hypothetical protein
MSKKGKEKNTKNKAKHTKLMNRKLNKLRDEKIQHQLRLKELVKKHHAQKNKRNDEKAKEL